MAAGRSPKGGMKGVGRAAGNEGKVPRLFVLPFIHLLDTLCLFWDRFPKGRVNTTGT